MKKERLFGNGLMRLAACVVMVFVCVGSVWAQSVAPINPAFKQWQKERKQETEARQSTTNATQSSRRRLASGGEAEGELGFAPGTFDTLYLSSLNVNSQQGVSGGFARRYDLREHSILTSVKNQNPYGTCWAHATCASLESWLLKSENASFDFSENNMANLHGGDWGFDDGGNGDRATAYLVRWGGPALESDDPYPNPGGSAELAPARHVQNVRWIPGRTSYLDNDTIKQAILDFGATYVTYYHSSSYYKSSTASYYFYGNTSRSGNHAVALVGWDDDYPASKFAKAPPGNGAFIVRNSWGASWGENGYFYVSYYDESFAWRTLYSFSSAEAVDNYDSVYGYDPLGLVTSLGYGSTSAWGANMFQAASATKIAAVGFYALTPNTTYTIYVYAGSTAGTPRSGTLAATQSGKSEYAGYVTVPLTSPVSVSARQIFSVVVQLTTPGYNFPLACEYAYSGYTSDATASSGQSFLSSNGSSWSDFTSWNGSANFCCKAYTKAVVPVKPTLSSIAISGMSSLTSGQSAQFTCEATYSDSSKKSVMPTWSITEGRNYATISSAGLVTAKSVTAQQQVTVKASYTEDGVTKEATWGFYVTVAAPSAPTGVTATQGTETSCIRVNWTAPNGATEYAVYRALVNNSKNAQYLETVTVPKFNDTTAVPGVNYWYFIKAKNSSGTSGFSSPGALGWLKLGAPDNVTATDNLLDKVVVSWSEIAGANFYYRVYRADEFDGTKTALGSGWQTATTFDDTTATPGVIYYYFVTAAVDASGSRPSDYSVFDDGMRAEPVRVVSLAINGAASIASGGSATYTATATYTDGTTGNVSPTWSFAGGNAYATLSGAKVTAKTVTANQSVTLRAVYIEDGITVTADKAIAITAVTPSVPTGLTLVSQTASGIVLSWNSTAGTASYKVYRAVGSGTPSSIGTATATSFTDSTAMPGVTYAYSVSAVNGAGESVRSATVSGIVPLAAPTGVTATSDRTDGVLVSWTAVNGATHYRVSRAISATGSKTDLGSWQTGTSYLDTSATAGTTYYYFIRAATSSGGANASGYSSSAQGVRKVAVTLSSISISGSDKVSASKTVLYTCTATYSDGTSRSVSPTWSVSGAATIDANGKLTANAVSANSTATVTASFTDGMTKTANKTVTLIAPVKATAEVRNINVASRWPFGSLLDIDYELIVNPVSAKAMVSVYGRDEDHGADIAAKTLSGDGADGSYIAAGSHRLTWDIGADYTNFHAKTFSVTMTATPSIIGVPGNVTVSASTSGVTLNWSAVDDADGYEVWRGMGTTTNGATRIATVTGATTYFDGTGVAGTTYRYWLRASGEDGLGEFAQPITGTRTVIAPVSLTISGASSVTAGNTVTYTCTVSRNDGTSGTVTPTWSITGGSSYASISSAGVLTAYGTATQRSVTIQASYTQNGTTKTATKTVTINTKTVTISFNGNGGTASTTSQSYTAYGTYGSLPTATRTGYTFTGWWTAASGGTQVTTSSIVPASETTLYAHWTPHTYTIHFDANGGTGTMADMAMTYDVATNLTANVFTNDGWAFTGWATAADGAVVYMNVASVTNLSMSNGSTVVLFAVWGLGAPTNIRHQQSSYCEESLTGSGKVSAVWYIRHVFSWDAANGATSYKVFRNTVNDLASATLLSTVTTTNCEFTVTGAEPAYYYWVVAAKGTLTVPGTPIELAATTVDLMPLRNLLTTLEAWTRDGYLSDDEINKAIIDTSYGNIDSDNTRNSPEEMYVYTRIKTLNADKELIHDVMRGDYTNIGGSMLLELFELSECIRVIQGGSSDFCLYPKRPSNVAATQQDYSTAKVVVSWTGIADAQCYEVWRSASSNYTATATKIAEVANATSYVDTDVSYRAAYSYMIRAKYADGNCLFSPTYAYGYWGAWCLAGVYRDLMPLRNLLTTIEYLNPDGYVSDNEINRAINDPTVADIDGNHTNNSAEEMDVYTRIKTLNEDKELIRYVMMGNYTYRNMTRDQMIELQAISDKIKTLAN